MEKKLKVAKIETLDDEFNVCQSIAPASEWAARESVIPSGNVRVTFSSGAAIDLFVEGDELFVAGQSRARYLDEVLLAGASAQGHDFVITVRTKKRTN